MNREKIHLKLKKEREKIQHQYKNFDQHHHNNFQLQDQSKEHNSHWSFQQDFQQESHDFWQFFRQDCSRSKNCFFIKKCDYCRENHFCFKCDYLNHSAKNCKFSFNSNWVSVKDDKIKLQSFRTWSRKCIRVQILCASSFNDNDKTDHNVYIITDDSKFNSDKLCKHSKN